MRIRGQVSDFFERPNRIAGMAAGVVAAALIAEATVVVTNDTSPRSELVAADLGVEALDGDTFVLRLWEESPPDVIGVIDALGRKARTPGDNRNDD